MSARFAAVAAILAAATSGAAAVAVLAPPPAALRVCADPNNLPFSNERGRGFENAIAALVARDMKATVRYTWWAQRRGFVRNTLRAGRCDVILGVPAGYDAVRTTRPYYRSTYVFVYPADRGLGVRSLDDEVLRHLRIGVHVIGDDYANAPPAHALTSRGMVHNVKGYSIYGNYAEPNPPARLVEAVAEGEIDVAIVWGPLAGYFAPRQRVALQVVPISPRIDPPSLPFVFDIAMGVRRDDAALQERLNAIIERKGAEIDAVLRRFGVPALEPDGPVAGAAPRQASGTHEARDGIVSTEGPGR